uniref:Cullin family profile domain-containing protein n=1 Tax=Panagrolaimus sp. PS1159 TaxID=55785 RepID=A0AC35GBM4_9BILA
MSYENSWRLLKAEITNILNNEHVHTSFEDCYRHAYSIVLHHHGEKLYFDLAELFKRHLIEKVRPSIINASDFLPKLIESRKVFCDSLVSVRDIVFYLERVFINQQRRELLYVITLGQHLFNTEIILNSNVNDRINTVMSEMIESSRKSENWEELKASSKMLLEFGEGNRKIYEECFEKIFLEKSAEFYKSESQKYLKNGCEFVKKIGEILNIEEKFVHFLDPTTLSKLNIVLIHELITSNIQTIINNEDSGLDFMLKNDKFEELNCLQYLLDLVPNDINCPNFVPVMSNIEDHVIKHIHNCWSKDIAEINELLFSHNFIEYIQTLFDLEKEFEMFAKKYFKIQSRLSKKVHDEIHSLLNPDSQLLSLYINHHLKKGTTKINENDIFAILEKAVSVFKYLSEKDVFEKYYKNHLAKRLLFDKSVSKDTEKFFISRLKEECGINFTQKIEAMLKDIEISNDLMTSYKNKNADKNDIDLNIQILTKGYWPMSDIHSCILPISAEIAFNKFKDFYLSKHSGRTLTINPNFGFVDLKATFYKEKNIEETKILTVTTLQMCILMKFNESKFFTFEELLNQTKINEKNLKRALESLTIGKESQKILIRNGNENHIEKNDIFSVNDNFSSKLNRIKIQMIPAKNEIRKKEEILSEINDDRKHEIEAAIIRIMKSRQKLIHNELITEVTKLLQQRFLPDPIIIKKRIEALIEREYLKRDESDLNFYHYIS